MDRKNQSKLKSNMVNLLNEIETMWARKKKVKYFQLNPGRLMTGFLFCGLWNNAHITCRWKLYPKQPRTFLNSLLIVVKKKHVQTKNFFGFTYPADIFSGMCFPHLPMTTDPSFSHKKCSRGLTFTSSQLSKKQMFRLCGLQVISPKSYSFLVDIGGLVKSNSIQSLS